MLNGALAPPATVQPASVLSPKFACKVATARSRSRLSNAARIDVALAADVQRGLLPPQGLETASAIMSVVQASLRVIAAEPAVTLPQLAARMNHFVYRSTAPSTDAIFFYGELGEDRVLRYVNAAQSPVCVVPAATGVIDELAPGDLLLAATDGVTDALNPREEDFGEERLKALLPRLAPLPVDEIAAGLLAELRAWIEDAAQYDDLTFVLLKAK